MYSGNKGEWSELYAFLKILGEGCIVGADEKLNKIDDWTYPVEKIIRNSLNDKKLQYEINSELGIVRIIAPNTPVQIETPQSLAKEKANVLLGYLQSQQSSSFQIEELETYWESLLSPKMKASSSSKSDITLVIRDFKNRLQKEVGFSIKSRLGNASTLFNAGKSTNFKYEVAGIEKLDNNQIAKAKEFKAMKLVKWLHENECKIKYESTLDERFLNNLQIIDTSLDSIMATLTLGHYLGKGNVQNLVSFLVQTNPCNYAENVKESFYTYKVKQFLSASALGMTATSSWDGVIDATGGYLVVKEDGELVCYHIYNWNALQTYLFENTRLETASTSRHDFGYLYKDEKDQRWKIDLNLQVRFI